MMCTRRFCAVVGVLGVCGWAMADINRVDDSTPGSVLIFPAVELRWDASNNLIQDTFITLTNDATGSVRVEMFFVNGDPPLNEAGVRFHPGWNWADVELNLTSHQPTYWSSVSGQPGGVIPFSLLDSGSPPGRPAPDGSGERVLRGYLVVFAIDSSSAAEISWNHLKGEALTVNYDRQTAWRNNAWSYAANDAFAQGAETGTPGVLNFDGSEFEACHDQLLMEFFYVGSNGLSGGSAVTAVDTDLTLLPVDADLRQDSSGPVTTRAVYDVWNENEFRFSGTARCITCWDQALISDYDSPNNLLKVFGQTDTGKVHIDGAQSAICSSSVESPLLGVASRVIEFASGPAVKQSGTTLSGFGTQSASLQFDVIGPPEELLDAVRQDTPGVDREDDRDSPVLVRMQDAAAAASSEPADMLRGVEPLDNASTSQTGSLLIFPDIEIAWNSSGQLVQDTLLEVTNDNSPAVTVHYAFVNGDEPLGADGPERAHPGWNHVICESQFTANQPISFSAAQDGPGNCRPFVELDPGSPPGRPDLEEPGRRMMRGFLLVWAVDDTGQEISWNHLDGAATIIDYEQMTVWEYTPTAFRALDQGGTVQTGDLTGTPFTLNLDGVEFDPGHTNVLLDFFATGSSTLSGGGSTVITDADLTLMPLDIDLRAQGLPTRTRANFNIYNFNETRFSGHKRCVSCWNQALASGDPVPNFFLLTNIQTNNGYVRVEPVADAGECADGPQTAVQTAILGVATVELDMDGVNARAGVPMTGSGKRTATINLPAGLDCNGNGVADAADISAQSSSDCNANQVPDECDLAGPSHNCCSGAGEHTGCNDFAIQSCVCGMNPSCCNVTWSQQCINQVDLLGCGSCFRDDNGNGLLDTCEEGSFDFDGDGDVDDSDGEAMVNCMTGPLCDAPSCALPAYDDPTCGIADGDGDGDIDLADWYLYELAVGM